MILVAKELQQAAGEVDLSVKENAYTVAVSLVSSIATHLESCKLQEESLSGHTVKRMLVPVGV